MQSYRPSRHWFRLARTAACLLASSAPALGQLGPHCTVAALNRTAPVDERGVWVLPNVPSGAGPMRVRATCVEPSGEVRRGQSDFFQVPTEGLVPVTQIVFESPVPVPSRLTVSSPNLRLTSLGETLALSATVTFVDGSVRDVSADPGTSWTTSNTSIASVTPQGQVTAHRSGTVVLSALHEGALGLVRVQVVLSRDSDGDGIPDDVEISLGLDPNNPVDGFDDPDRDLLATAAELAAGSNPSRPDTDGDGLLDGDEVLTRGTSPVLADTDGDAFRDGLEVQTGSDPLDAANFNLAGALASLRVEPGEFTLVFNSIETEVSRRVAVAGELLDGTRLDLLEPRFGTTFRSSNLAVASLGSEPGQIFAGVAGAAVVSALAGGQEAGARVHVETFSPQPLGNLTLTGAANDVVVQGSWVFVAAGGAGLHVVDASHPSAPRWVTRLRLPGSAYALHLAGEFLFVAAGTAGLQVVDVSSPEDPVLVGAGALQGPARGVAVAEGTCYVIDDERLTAFDVSVPTSPVWLGEIVLPGPLRDVVAEGGRVLVPAGEAGVHVVDATTPTNLRRVTTLATRPDLRASADRAALRDARAYVADGAFELGGVGVVDLSITEAPFLANRSSDEFGLRDVALDGAFLLAADYLYSNAVPIFNVAGTAPSLAGLIQFGGDLQGQAVAVQDGLVFLVGSAAWERFQDWGSCVLHIGRYARREAAPPFTPSVRVLPLLPGERAKERRRLTLRAEVSDTFGLAEVRFEVDGSFAGADFERPFEAEITVPEGTSLEVRATARYRGGSQSVSVPVVVPIEPDATPFVTLLEPWRSLDLRPGLRYRWSAAAADDGFIQEVRVLLDGVLLSTFTRAPFEGIFQAPSNAGALTFRVEATDNVGQSSSENVSFRVVSSPGLRPTVVEPAPGSSVIAGSTVRVLVGLPDDTAPRSVGLQANGVDVGELTRTPFSFLVPVEPSASELRLIARATDRLGEIATSHEVAFEVIPDPGTTAIGSVETPGGTPVGGAVVECEGVSGVTDAEGEFLIPGVPAQGRTISCLAQDAAGGAAGNSAQVAPVPSGVTSVGPILVSPIACVTGHLVWSNVDACGSGPVFDTFQLEFNDMSGGPLVPIETVTPLAPDGFFCLNLRLGGEYRVARTYGACPAFGSAFCEAGLFLLNPSARGLCGEANAVCEDLGEVLVGCTAGGIH